MFLRGRKRCACALGMLTWVVGCGGPKEPSVVLDNKGLAGPSAKQLAEQLDVEMALFKVDTAEPTMLYLSYDLWSHETQVKKNELIASAKLEPSDKQVTVMWNETPEGLNVQIYSGNRRTGRGLVAYKPRPPRYCHGHAAYDSGVLKPDARAPLASWCYGKPYISMGRDMNMVYDAQSAKVNEQSFTLFVTVGKKGDFSVTDFPPPEASGKGDGGSEKGDGRLEILSPKN